jgi:hypothetical protein
MDAHRLLGRHVLGDEGATFDVFAVVHLLAGYGLTYLVARRLGVAPPLAAPNGLPPQTARRRDKRDIPHPAIPPVSLPPEPA